MKPIVLLFAACAVLFSFSGCTKSASSGPSAVAFSVDGLETVSINNLATPATLPVTFTYHNSAQEAITVSLGGTPSFITIGVPDANANGGTSYFQGPWTGIPTFSLNLSITVTNYFSYVAGTYPITVTCTTKSGTTTSYTFNLIAN